MTDEDKTTTPRSEPRIRPPWVLLFVFLALIVMWTFGLGGRGESIPYSQFKQHLKDGRIAECQLSTDYVTGKLAPSGTESAEDEEASLRFHAARVEDPGLIAELVGAQVKFSGVPETRWTQWIWFFLLPLFVLFFLMPLILRRMGSPGSAALRFGSSKARLIANLDTGVTFDDVAGCNEAKQDLAEVVEFLGHPERFVRLGAKIPKGLLLVGPPGTGKTLLARAVAGEASVPFYSLSGSDFVEMFVGVGASRVRDLFNQAKKHAPCIVFIDEIDAIGRTRGVHLGAVNDEREQTLNQLLVELDGFETNQGVILLAATNRPDVLDRALLRPGRFDRQVILDVPDVAGRLAILKVHARGKPLAEDVDLEIVAKSTPGFAGADLANALNEAALLAARRDTDSIGPADIEAAIEKLIAGPERKSRRMQESEKRRVAFHESGHAIVAYHSEHADPVHKISIVPRGRAVLGYTMQLPEHDHMMMTKSELLDKLTGLLGGRAAEDLVFEEPSSGAGNDLEQATILARQMVCLYGMGEAAGLMRCAREGQDGVLGLDGQLQRDCSEETAREIDKEVKQLLSEGMARARSVLTEHRATLDRLARALLVSETLDGPEFLRIVATRPEEETRSPANLRDRARP